MGCLCITLSCLPEDVASVYWRTLWSLCMSHLVFFGRSSGGGRAPLTRPIKSGRVSGYEVTIRVRFVRKRNGYSWEAYGDATCSVCKWRLQCCL